MLLLLLKLCTLLCASSVSHSKIHSIVPTIRYLILLLRSGDLESWRGQLAYTGKLFLPALLCKHAITDQLASVDSSFYSCASLSIIPITPSNVEVYLAGDGVLELRSPAQFPRMELPLKAFILFRFYRKPHPITSNMHNCSILLAF